MQMLVQLLGGQQQATNTAGQNASLSLPTGASLGTGQQQQPYPTGTPDMYSALMTAPPGGQANYWG
jgi:hypothetical protein